MNVLVTGAAGFIGRALASRLLDEGHQLSCLVRSSTPDGLPPDRIRLIHGDLLDPASLAEAVAEAEVVFHVAGVTRGFAAADYFRGNTEATRNLLVAVQQHARPACRFIYVSSLAAAGPCPIPPGLSEKDAPAPVSDYGRSKLEAEHLVLAVALQRHVVVIRPPVVYGPRDHGHLPLFRSAQRGILPLAGFGRLAMSAIQVDDLIDAMIRAAFNPAAAGQVYFVNDGECHDWADICRAAAAGLGRQAALLRIPLFAVRLLCRLGGFRVLHPGGPPYFNPDKWNEVRQKGWLCDGTKARQELGYVPRVKLAAGMAATARWYQDNGWL